MNITRKVKPLLLPVLLILGIAESNARATRDMGGNAMVAGLIGQAEVRLFTGPIHHGQTELVPLFKGAMVGETARIMTGRDSQLFLVVDSGAQIALGPRSEIILNRISGQSRGLPASQDEVIRVIDVEVLAGRVRFSPGGDDWSGRFTVKTRDGLYESSAGSFIVEKDPADGWMALHQSSEVRLKEASSGSQSASRYDSANRSFTMWRNLQRNVSPVANVPVARSIDRKALSRVIGVDAVKFLGPSIAVVAVSPTDPEPPPPPPPPPPEPPKPPDEIFKPDPPGKPVVNTQKETKGRNWSPEDIGSWYEDLGVIKGVSYHSPNVEDAQSMWLPENFNIELIREDFKLVKEAGYTDVRVELNIRAWLSDPDGFMDRLQQFVDLVIEHDLRFVPMMFKPSDFAGGDLSDDDVQNFLKAIMNNFTEAKEVAYWDLFNIEGIQVFDDQIKSVMDKVEQWARQVEPKQPISLDLLPDENGQPTEKELGRTDLITFQSFGTPEQVARQIEQLKKFNRPIICTGFLDRHNNNSFESLLPIFSVNKVGWFNKGLVRPEGLADSNGQDVWKHYVFDKDGNPYDENEIRLIKEFKFQESAQ